MATVRPGSAAADGPSGAATSPNPAARPKPKPAARRSRAARGPRPGGGGLLPRLWHTPPWLTLLSVAAAGCGFGWLYPNRGLEWPWGFIQSSLGWTYTAAWSLSFWPQVLLHMFIKDVSG
jgi:hypothetical protein